jgi:tetratricopeptide (TPR) repeat protein
LLCATIPLVQVRNGDLDGALATLDEGHAIAQRIGALVPQVDSDWIKAEILRWRGQYEDALTHGHRAVETALPLEEFMPFELVQPLGTLGTIYLEISGRFSDEVARFHQHAHRLLENPVGAMGGGTAWADLGWCALTLGDPEIAAQSFEKGLDYPTLFMRVERPRYLAGMALVELSRGHTAEAQLLAAEACDYVAERKMRHVAPLIWLVMGRVLAGSGEHHAALREFARAEEAAQKLAMRPLVWQSQAAAAESLSTLGKTVEAELKLQQVRISVQEIAALFQNDELREAYFQHAGSRYGLTTSLRDYKAAG